MALIAVVCIGAVTFLGTSGSGKLDKAGKGVKGESAGQAPGCYPTRTAEAPGYPAYYIVDANGVASAPIYGNCSDVNP